MNTELLRGAALSCFIIAVVLSAVHFLAPSVFTSSSNAAQIQALQEENIQLSEQLVALEQQVENEETDVVTTTPPESNESNDSNEGNEEIPSNEEDQSNEANQQNDMSEEENNPEDTQDDPEVLTVTIAPGTSAPELANELESLGIVNNAQDFLNQLRVSGRESLVQVGEFELSSDMTRSQIIEIITS
ncbi:hypothetical protein FLK61_29745 [Paenalkalicoccus suaedae]|uniref:Endolytic transglycosylase MltG n=1 Tax=Paenalkalicoccus suaedae TaxID=2592382 RepID=A0A859FCD9_9BACI|nr:hypothetical protein [Paenalkalicoccus suaedae]QKS70909.1 hypothetical protein FLK61_29745 [Paenalkalicoccus suaedae]